MPSVVNPLTKQVLDSPALVLNSTTLPRIGGLTEGKGLPTGRYNKKWRRKGKYQGITSNPFSKGR